MPPRMYPYLSYRDAATALHFLREAFGFTVNVRWDDPHGTVQHAEAAFGESTVMMGTVEHPTVPLEGRSVGQSIYVYVRGHRRALRADTGRWCAGGVPSGGHRVRDAPLPGARLGGIRVELQRLSTRHGGGWLVSTT
jgi:catechol 2,3-dioxygenase-like lactoylglutathione lyase family enzyme